MIRTRTAFAAVAAAGFALLPAAAASATTVPSTIGTITVEQYRGVYCDDFGADILIATDNGLPNTVYSATVWAFTASGTSPADQITVTYTTNASGDGSKLVLNTRTPDGKQIGTSRATVSASGTSVDVDYPIYCPGNQGG
jgi:hypothetical protein